jgi:hypothetical protein
MQKKPRNGSASTKRSVEDEIAHLRGLDLSGLRARWQSIFQKQAPTHLTRRLLFAVIAYRLQHRASRLEARLLLGSGGARENPGFSRCPPRPQ